MHTSIHSCATPASIVPLTLTGLSLNQVHLHNYKQDPELSSLTTLYSEYHISISEDL